MLLGPVSVQLGSNADGGTDPVTPTIVAVKVMIGPLLVLDC